MTTLNMMAFVKDGKLLLDELIEAQKLSARCGLRMTLVDLELPNWNAVQKRDRLLGCSLTGWKDAMAALVYTDKEEADLLKLLGRVAREEADRYAAELRVNKPLLVTTVKPEGTLSQVFGTVSSGLHVAHAPYFIRRIRINAQDPLAKAVLEHKGWNVHPEVGTQGDTFEEQMENARTLVIDFPIASGAAVSKDVYTVQQQFDTYFRFQKNYTEHNSSNTISVKPHEWDEASDIVFENWDNFVGVSFLANDGGTYQLTPYEEVSEDVVRDLQAQMQPFDFALLAKYESGQESELDANDPDCSTGACPTR